MFGLAQLMTPSLSRNESKVGNRRDGVVVRASLLQSTDVSLIPTSICTASGIPSFSAWHEMDSKKKIPVSSLVVPISMALRDNSIFIWQSNDIIE